jgi:hypothetical protein
MTTLEPSSPGFEYQTLILGLLGEDDPGDVASATPAAWRALAAEAGDRLTTRPADGEWSLVQLLGHAADAELVLATRLRWILAEERPPIAAYDQDHWVDALDHEAADPAALLDLFEAVRRSNVALWARSTPEQRARIGMHSERGPESFELTFRMLAGHDRFHLDQARRTLDTVLASG